MAIDFSALVLGPCQDAFGHPVSILPVASQPGQGAYAARGIWTVDDVNLVTEDGGNFSSRTLKLGIRLSEFPIYPKQGDRITSSTADLPLAYWEAPIPPAGTVDFLIDDFRPDGQGKADLILKRVPIGGA